MLKACFDCIIGRPEPNDVQEDRNINSGRGIRNGAQRRKAPWPPRPNMFHLPKELNTNDSITISGHLQQNANRFIVMLAIEEMDIFRFHADFNTNKMTVTVDNQDTEVPDYTTSSLFSDKRYKIRMIIEISEYEGNTINLFVNDNPLIVVRMYQNPQDITHILLDGDHDKFMTKELPSQVVSSTLPFLKERLSLSTKRSLRKKWSK